MIRCRNTRYVQIVYARTSGSRMTSATSITVRVCSVEEALATVSEFAGTSVAGRT